MSNPLIQNFFFSGQPLRVYKGEVITGFGEQPNAVYLINRGYIKAYSISGGGEEFIQHIYGESELFPLVWAYHQVNRPVFYQAVVDSMLFRMPLPRFSEFAQSSVAASHSLAMQLAQQFLIYSDRIENLEYKKSRQRVAYRLLFLAGRFGRRDGDDLVIGPPFTHQLIANTVNLARETVSRELEELQHSQLLANNKRRIIIKDLEGLGRQVADDFDIARWGLR